MLPLLICIIGAATAGISIAVLFNAVIDEDKSRLTQIVRSQARLMEAVAEFDIKHAEENHPGSAFGSTIKQIVAAHKSLDGFGKTGEFVIGKLLDGKAAILQEPRYKGDINFQVPEFVPVPMQKALAGERGEIVAADYKGHQVLASFEPVSILNIGLVAKIDMDEVYRPFLISGGIVAAFTFVMLVLGVYAARFFSSSFVEKEVALDNLSISQEKLEQAILSNKMILDAAGEGIYGVDLDGLCTFINPAAEKLLGWQGGELIGKQQHDILHHTKPDGSHYPRTECPVYEAFKDGKVRTVDDEVFWRRDGSSIPVEYTSTPIFENDETTGAVVIFRDVSERRETEETLRKSELKYRQIIDTTSEGYWLIDGETRTLEVNRALCDMLGYEPEEFVGRKPSEFTDDEGRAVFEAQHTTREDQNQRLYEVPLIAKDGRRVLAKLSATFLNGNLTDGPTSFAFVADITERKHAELALKEAHQFNESVLSSSPVGIAMYDDAGQCVSANDAVAGIVGATREQVLSQNYHEIASWKGSGLYDMALECMSSGERLRHEVHVKTTLGRKAILDCHLVPVSVNEVRHLLVMLNDITENRNMQEQLIQSSKMATLGEMATGVAHELNQPLNIIRLALNNIQRKSKKNAADPQYLADKLVKIDSQVDRATAIIEHMRIFGRKPDAVPVPLDMKHMVDSTLGLLGEQLRLAEIEVTVEAPQGCRPILGHQVQVEQVLLNLLGNARDTLSDKQDGDKRISITIGEDGPSVVIAVEDTGGGIDADSLGRVFEPFFTTKEIGQGTGLGLSISYGIIKDMGGTITATNTGDGARFVITLPTYEEDTVAA